MTDARDGAAPNPDPANDGAFAVALTTASIPGAAPGRTLTASIYAPASGTARPLVIVSPGFQMERTQYASYARHLATWGFVVVLADYADRSFFAEHTKLAGDVSAVIDWALAQPALAIDTQKIAVAGHSLGGKLGVLAASNDARIRAIVAWDPVDSANPSVVPDKPITAALAVIGETTNASGGGMPCAPAAENYEQFYAAASTPSISITITGADHMDWVDDPSCGFCGFCAPGSVDPALVRTVTRRLDVAWLRRILDGDTAMDQWLDAPPEVAVLTIARR